jgi:hypothetical protein
MAYELWDTTSANLLGTYDTEDAALGVVRQALDAHGESYVHRIALGYEDSRGRSKAVATGAALVNLTRVRRGAA